MLTLLHTAAVHVATFDTLRDQIAPGAALRHLVHPELLAEAQDGISPDLEARIADLVGAPGPVICTCTTIGEVAARHGATRIDQPMMRKAASLGRVVMAYALDSTKDPSCDLFLAEGGRAEDLQMLDLTHLWPLFERQDVTAFHAAIADAVREVPGDCDGIVLAQASMAGAARLVDEATPVLTSPELALRHGLAISG
ncbi:hypothetical protein [Pseudooceanicola sp. MF1-13]|uniref:hypothetical protein n=1 Tax=Pseudooceanicola sp. MF1-13 TaxID=3379095 RepID=UPI003891BE37